jgi:hypothetical protein
MIRDLPSSVTSIQVLDSQPPPPIQCNTPLFIDHLSSQSLETFLNNDQTLAHTCNTYIFMERANCCTIAVSFVGPSTGNLTLQLKHHADRPGVALMITVAGTSFSLTIPDLLTIDDINLHPIGNSPSQLSFAPNTRNNLILQTCSLMFGYALQDLQLLDEDGNPYGQPSQRYIPALEFDALATTGTSSSSSNN